MGFSFSPLQSRALADAVSYYRHSVRSSPQPIVGKQDLARLERAEGHLGLFHKKPSLYGAALYVLKRAFADSDAYLQRWHYRSEARAYASRYLQVFMKLGLDTEWNPTLKDRLVGVLPYLRDIGAIDSGKAREAAAKMAGRRRDNPKHKYPLSRPTHASEDYLDPTLPMATVRVDAKLLAWACTQVFHPTKTHPMIDPAVAQSLGLALASTDSRNDPLIKGQYPFTMVTIFPDPGTEFPLVFPHQVFGARLPKWIAAKLLAHTERRSAKT